MHDEGFVIIAILVHLCQYGFVQAIQEKRLGVSDIGVVVLIIAALLLAFLGSFRFLECELCVFAQNGDDLCGICWIREICYRVHTIPNHVIHHLLLES